MTDHERSLLIAKFQVICHRSLEEIRNLALCKATGQIYDLADAVEIIPQILLHWDDERANTIRSGLVKYVERYPYSAGCYVSILDMEETVFHNLYIHTTFLWDTEDMPRQVDVSP